MPIHVTTDDDGKLLFIHYEGSIGPRDYLQLLDKLENEVELDAEFSEITDMTAVDSISLTDGQISQIAQMTAGIYFRSNGPVQLAFVAPQEPIRTMADRYLGLLREFFPGLQAKRFDAIEDAYKYLKIPKQAIPVSAPPQTTGL